MINLPALVAVGITSTLVWLAGRVQSKGWLTCVTAIVNLARSCCANLKTLRFACNLLPPRLGVLHEKIPLLGASLCGAASSAWGGLSYSAPNAATEPNYRWIVWTLAAIWRWENLRGEP